MDASLNRRIQMELDAGEDTFWFGAPDPVRAAMQAIPAGTMRYIPADPWTLRLSRHRNCAVAAVGLFQFIVDGLRGNRSEDNGYTGWLHAEGMFLFRRGYNQY